MNRTLLRGVCHLLRVFDEQVPPLSDWVLYEERERAERLVGGLLIDKNELR